MKEEIKRETKTTIQKTKTVDVETKKGGKYSYRYTELADINAFIEELGERYYQYIKRIENDDYIITKRIGPDAPKEELQGCRVVQAPVTSEYSNPAQEQGSALTYARRYSLLMAYGLATEDDDANSLNRPKQQSIETKEEAENYVITFGKYKGKTLKEIYDENESYLDWLLDNEKTDETIKQAIEMIINDEEETDTKISKSQILEIKELMKKIGTTKEEVAKRINVEDLNEIDNKKAELVITMLECDLQNKSSKVDNEKLNKVLGVGNE
jgi:uncharacterized protein (DUF3820 family)